jgi:small GTP-binding protein
MSKIILILISSLYFKYIIVGNSGTGKTTFLQSLTDKIIKEEKSTIGVDYRVKRLSLYGKKVTTHIWDTAGLPKYHHHITAYYRNFVCAFILYDITNQESFNNLDYWLNDIKGHGSKYSIIVLIGNKSDNEKNRVIPKIKGEEYASLNNLKFFEVSSLNISSNIEDIFMNITKEITIKVRDNDNNIYS